MLKEGPIRLPRHKILAVAHIFSLPSSTISTEYWEFAEFANLLWCCTMVLDKLYLCWKKNRIYVKIFGWFFNGRLFLWSFQLIILSSMRLCEILGQNFRFVNKQVRQEHFFHKLWFLSSLEQCFQAISFQHNYSIHFVRHS